MNGSELNYSVLLNRVLMRFRILDVKREAKMTLDEYW